jgi:hypothetical protein
MAIKNDHRALWYGKQVRYVEEVSNGIRKKNWSLGYTRKQLILKNAS